MQMNLLETNQKDIRFVAQASGSFAHFRTQFAQIMAADILHLDLFQVTSDAFIGVQGQARSLASVRGGCVGLRLDVESP